MTVIVVNESPDSKEQVLAVFLRFDVNVLVFIVFQILSIQMLSLARPFYSTTLLSMLILNDLSETPIWGTLCLNLLPVIEIFVNVSVPSNSV